MMLQNMLGGRGRGINKREMLQDLHASLCRNPSTPEIIGIAGSIVDILQGETARSEQQRQVQNYAARIGLVEKLVEMSQTKTNFDAQASVLLCLSELCFSNYDLKKRVFESSHIESTPNFLLSLLETTNPEHIASQGLDADSRDALLCRNENAFWLVNAMTSQLWEYHPAIISLYLDVSLNILNTPSQDPRISSCCVRFLNLLSYNTECRNSLQPAIDPLIGVMQSGDIRIGYFTAALAVANLGYGSNHANLHTPNGSLFSEFMNAFSVTLRGTDYPVDSGNYYTPWKMCWSLVNLCSVPTNRDQLLGAGVMGAIDAAMAKAAITNDNQLCENALKALWYLSEDVL